MPFLSSIFHHSHRVFPREFKTLFVAKLLHASGLQLSLLFLPLFLFQVGSAGNYFDAWGLSAFQQGMMFVGGYFLLERIWVLIWCVPASQIISIIGVRNGMIVGQILNIVTLIFFSFAQKTPELLFFTALIEGLKICFFWSSYFSLFSTTAVYKNMGTSVGTFEFFTKLVYVILPTISATMILRFGFSSVFVASIMLHIISALILFKIHNPLSFAPVSWKEFASWLKEREFQKLLIAGGGKYFVDALDLLWPFFILLLVGSVEKVGFIFSLVLFLSLIITYFGGWYVDHSKSRRPFTLSGTFLSILWLVRIFLFNVWSIITIDTIDKLASSFFVPFYDSIFLRRGKGNHALAYFTYREVVLSVVAIGFWTIFCVYFLAFDSWRGFLLFGFVGMLGSLQMNDRKKHA